MDNTLSFSSNIWWSKIKFFIFRILTYFPFLLIPIYVQKSLDLIVPLQCLMMGLYILFIMGQWFLLGKEIDYRLKIYYKINSSMDRIVYRTFLGMSFFVVYFNLLSLLPHKWTNNIFWVTWVITGLFYSWPTRGKIIKESVSTNFGEFKFLDSFEKTLLGLIFIFSVFSLPELPTFNDSVLLKNFFDPEGKFHNMWWNFLTVNFYPFKKYPQLFKVAWSMHFYVVGVSSFLLALYALLRFFISRRLALLGIFAVISSWNFSKILAGHYGAIISSTFILIWIWSVIWSSISSTYRSGLYLGMMSFFGVMINANFFYLMVIHLLVFFFYFLKEKSFWFRRQLLRYLAFGLALALICFIFAGIQIDFDHIFHQRMFSELVGTIRGKAFYGLSYIGLVIIFFKLVIPKFKLFSHLDYKLPVLQQLALTYLISWSVAFVIDKSLVDHVSYLWPVVVLTLLPIDSIFQSIHRLRSKRNMIYLTYIIICLLDSRLEGRIKIVWRLFD